MIFKSELTANQKALRAILISLVLQMIVLASIYIQSQNARDDLEQTEAEARAALVVSQRASCERSKLDRQDAVDFQKAHSRYISKVVLAQSVKEDVKRAAREAQLVYKRTSESLAERARIDCKVAFPNSEDK